MDSHSYNYANIYSRLFEEKGNISLATFFCQSLTHPTQRQRMAISVTGIIFEKIVSPCGQCLWLVVLCESEPNQLPFCYHVP